MIFLWVSFVFGLHACVCVFVCDGDTAQLPLSLISSKHTHTKSSQQQQNNNTPYTDFICTFTSSSRARVLYAQSVLFPFANIRTARCPGYIAILCIYDTLFTRTRQHCRTNTCRISNTAQEQEASSHMRRSSFWFGFEMWMCRISLLCKNRMLYTAMYIWIWCSV